MCSKTPGKSLCATCTSFIRRFVFFLRFDVERKMLSEHRVDSLTSFCLPPEPAESSAVKDEALARRAFEFCFVAEDFDM